MITRSTLKRIFILNSLLLLSPSIYSIPFHSILGKDTLKQVSTTPMPSQIKDTLDVKVDENINMSTSEMDSDTLKDSQNIVSKDTIEVTTEDQVKAEESAKSVEESVSSSLGSERYAKAISLLFEQMEIMDGYKILKEEANRGDLASQLFLALYPYPSQFNTLNPSLEQIVEGAETGDANSAYLLGKAYLGSHYIINIDHAVEWLEKASKGKNNQANHLLSQLELEGLGIAKNSNKSFEKLVSAAKQKDTTALRMVADSYLHGSYGQKRSPQKAIPYLLPLAQNGQILAQRQLGEIYYKGKRSKSILWYHKASKQGDSISTKILANLYYKGEGVVRDYSKAKALYLQLADQNDAEAMAQLGQIYFYGKGVKRNYGKACEWYEKAMKLGVDHVASNLADCYDHGWGVKRDPVYRDFILGKANIHYKLTSKEKKQLGDQAHLYSLAAKMDVDFSGIEHFRIGREFEKKGNFKEAFRWNKLGAELGYSKSHRKLAEYYIKGLGTKVERDSALHHYIIAASLGDKASYQPLSLYNYKRVNPKVINKDIKALEKIAYDGNKTIANFLGECYNTDKLGVEYNQEKADYWSKIAKSGNKPVAITQWKENQWSDIEYIKSQAYAQNYWAQTILGYWYLKGVDGQENLSDGLMWLHSALEGGSTEAVYLLAQIYHSGYKTILPDQELADKYSRIAIQSPNAMVQYAAIALKQTKQNSTEEIAKQINQLEEITKIKTTKEQQTWIRWIEKHSSSITNNLDSNYLINTKQLLARIYFYGPSPIQDLKKARLYYEQAYRMGSQEAMINLGFINEFGIGAPSNSSKALFYWRSLAKQNTAISKAYLYRAYQKGIGTRKNARYAQRYKIDSSLL